MLPKSLDLKRLFDYDFPSSWRKAPKCALCCNELSIGQNKTKSGHRPMALSCFHTVCDKCVYGCRKNSIVCKQCNKPTKINRNFPIRQNIEFNYYLYGLLTYTEHILKHDIKQYAPLTIEPQTNQYECHECNSTYTNYICIQCSVPYCQVCFRNVHKSGKALKKHCLSSFKNNILLNANDIKNCSLHQRMCNIYCSDCKSEICNRCTNEAHKSHEVLSIIEENKKTIPQLLSVIESVKIAKEYNRQAQKSTRALEKKYEDFAANAIEDVTNYFTMLHAALQIIERQYLTTIKNKTTPKLEKLKNLIATLARGAQTLDEVKETLDKFTNDLPNVPLTVVIERTNIYLESMPCNVEFENCDENPFSFNILSDAVTEIKKCQALNVNEQSFSSKMLSFFGSKSCSENTSIEESFNNIFASLKMNSEKSISSCEELSRTILKPPTSSVVKAQKVFVSYIESPTLFYIQKQMLVIEEFKTICKEEAQFGTTPDYIELKKLYLVFDPVTKTWFRAKVIEKSRDNLYKVLLIDVGQCTNVAKQRFREISKELSSRPLGAVPCSIYGIKPQNKTWSDEATLLMTEIIQNEMVTMIMLSDNGNETCQVDIVAHHHKYATSIRDALLFSNLAEPVELEEEMIQKLPSIESMKKNLIPPITANFFKNVFKNGESFKAIILHIISPQEFYAAKYDHSNCIEALSKELNEAYEESQPKIFVVQINMPCAVCINGNWLRARVTKLLDKGNCRVWLVDQGQYETVHWKKMRTLQEIFLKTNEYVIQCSLVDIEPRQENDYTWTENAISEFKRITKNSTLQIFIHKSKEFRYKVSVYVVKKSVDYNVNALMVKYGHALSTGNESTCIEYPKVIEPPRKEIEDMILHTLEKPRSSQRKINNSNLMKTKIKITHIISPGEFYIHLVNHVKGMKSLHGEIQTIQQTIQDGYKITSDWQIGDNCLVLCSVKKDTNQQWYRGFISSIYATEKETKYTVFLRDYGSKCGGITIENLAPIDPLQSRICNGAIKCHMACVQPTGGLDIWSYSSIDELKNILDKFECLSATIQGERKDDSIPVILFGMTTECADPLSPNINKWVNINKVLVNCGLAHLTEKFDLMIQNEKTIEKEHKEIQLSLANSIDTLRQIDAEPQDYAESELSFDLKADSDDFIETKGMVKSWLPAKPIEKTVFTAYPTFVDNAGVIYLHDALIEPFLTKMRDCINSVVANTEPNKDVSWKIGQACLAKYHNDQLFYRATVVKIKAKDIIVVQFVDYGNTDECVPDDLREIIVLPHIPIQAHKYLIDKVVPKNGENYSTDALDFIQINIILKLCSIRVSENQEKEVIKKCSIRFEIYDIAELLLSSGYAVKCHHTQANEKLICDSYSTDDEQEDIIIPTTPTESSPIKKTILDTDDYQKMFEKIELENLYNSIFEDSADEGNSDNDIIELEHTFHTGFWQHKCDNSDDTDDEGKNLAVADSSSVSSFNPLETSSISSRYELFKKFPTATIPTGLTKFYCEVTFIRDSTHLFISPCITELQHRFADMSTQIQHLSKSCSGLKMFQPNTPCLALYKVDNLWYRAIIRSYSPEIETAEVIFVDFLNVELVFKNDIKKCPPKLLSIPTRNILVKLHGLKPNPRWREVDILRALSERVCDRKIFTKIVSNREFTQVELFESEKENTLIYEGLINERYYIRLDPY